MIVFSYFNVFIFFTFSTYGAMPGVVKKCIKAFSYLIDDFVLTFYFRYKKQLKIFSGLSYGIISISHV